MNYIQIIITIFITAIITHFLTLYRERKQWNRTLELQKIQDYNKAAYKFRSEFSEALRTLKQVYDLSCYQILVKFIKQHEIATIQFKPHLSDEDLSKLDIVWKEYICSHQKTPDRINLNVYSWKNVIKEESNLNIKDKDSAEKYFRNLAIQRIEKLLECAKPK